MALYVRGREDFTGFLKGCSRARKDGFDACAAGHLGSSLTLGAVAGNVFELSRERVSTDTQKFRRLRLILSREMHCPLDVFALECLEGRKGRRWCG